MNLSTNPYESPRTFEIRPSWKDRLRRWWASLFEPQSLVQRFLAGKRVFHCGVVFQIVPSEERIVFGMLPLPTNDADYVRRNVNEARRMLGQFIETHPELEEVLRGRTLIVSMTPSYTELDEQICCEFVPANTWDADLPRASDAAD